MTTTKRFGRTDAGRLLAAATVTVALTAAAAAPAGAADVAADPVGTPDSCLAGSGYAYQDRVDCVDARASFIPGLVDTATSVLGIDLPLDLASLNSAKSIQVFVLGGGNARISGSGFTTAISALRGSASAHGANGLGGAIAAAFGGSARAGSGLAGISLAGSVPVVDDLSSVFSLLGDPTLGLAEADASLGGAIALTSSSQDVKVLVFGGIGSAVTDKRPGGEQVTCAALYCSSSVAGGPSTASLLFLFGKDVAGPGAPTAYSLRNPFSVFFRPVLTPGLKNTIDIAAPAANLLGVDALKSIDVPAVTNLAQTPIAVDFGSDIVRFVTGGDEGVFRIESDIPILREFLQLFWPAAAPAEQTVTDGSAASTSAADDGAAQRVKRSAPDDASDVVEGSVVSGSDVDADDGRPVSEVTERGSEDASSAEDVKPDVPVATAASTTERAAADAPRTPTPEPAEPEPAEPESAAAEAPSSENDSSSDVTDSADSVTDTATAAEK